MKRKRPLLVILLILMILVFVVVLTVFIFMVTGVITIPPETSARYKNARETRSVLTKSVAYQKLELQKLQTLFAEEKDLIDRDRLFYLNTWVAVFELKNDRSPTVMELLTHVKDLPEEAYSGDNTIYGQMNGRGGWYYDTKHGRVEMNIKR